MSRAALKSSQIVARLRPCDDVEACPLSAQAAWLFAHVGYVSLLPSAVQHALVGVMRVRTCVAGLQSTACTRLCVCAKYLRRARSFSCYVSLRPLLHIHGTFVASIESYEIACAFRLVPHYTPAIQTPARFTRNPATQRRLR